MKILVNAFLVVLVTVTLLPCEVLARECGDLLGDANGRIQAYNKKINEYNDYVRTHAVTDQAKKIRKEADDKLPKIQASYDQLKQQKCDNIDNIKWPYAIRK